MNHRLIAFVLALLSASLALPVAAERTADHYVKACGMTGTPSTVVVDVYNDAAPGTILATIPNAQVGRFGTTQCYEVNLATTTAAIGYPDSDEPIEKHYTLVFRDDSASRVYLTESVSGLVGFEMYALCAGEVPVYPTVTVSVRGITAQVIAAGKPSHFEIQWDCTRVFASPLIIGYWVFYYDVDGRVNKKLPSFAPPSP